MAEEISREFSDNEVSFLIETINPRLMAKRGMIRSHQSLVEEMLDQHNEKLFERIISMEEEEMLIKISPRLLFEILLRKTARVLNRESYMLERVGRQLIPIFETMKASEFLAQKAVLTYLAEMLSSFTKIESFTFPIRVKGRVWRKLRFNDMDIDSLISFCQVVDEEYRFGFYKRIADACLFILGIFPEYVTAQYRYPLSGQIRPSIAGQKPKAPEEYEREGKKFYQLAAKHPFAQMMNLEGTLNELAENFNLAKKPLNFIADYYLQFKRRRIFHFDA